MILGIGNDLSNIQRIEKSLQKFGERFVERTFSEAEKKEMAFRKNISFREYACSAAKRFAAKEACSKALGTGFRDGVFMRDIEIMHQASGQPVLTLYNGALRRLEMLSGGKEVRLHVTMTDDYPWAQAFVIFEVLP